VYDNSVGYLRSVVWLLFGIWDSRGLLFNMLGSQLIGRGRSTTGFLKQDQPQLASGGKKRPPSTISAVRNLARLLQRIQTVDRDDNAGSTIEPILLTALQQTLPSSSKIRARVESTVRGIIRIIQTDNDDNGRERPRATRGKNGNGGSCKKRSLSARISDEDIAQAVYRAFYFETGQDDNDKAQQQREQNRPTKRRKKTGYNVFFSEYTTKQQQQGDSPSSGSISSYQSSVKIASRAWKNLSPKEKSRYDRRANISNSGGECPLIVQTTAGTETTATELSGAAAVAMVSDSESASIGIASRVEEDEKHQLETGHGSHPEQAATHGAMWASFLECVNLLVAAETASSCVGIKLRPRGKGITFELYTLAGPAASTIDIRQVRNRIQTEFLSLFDGSGTVKWTRQARLAMRDCRVHAVMNRKPLCASEQSSSSSSTSSCAIERSLWIQINVGQSEYADEVNDVQAAIFLPGMTVAKKSRHCMGVEFIAIVVPESNRIALSRTSGGVASRSRYTPLVVSALEAALTCVASEHYNSNIGTNM